MNFDDLPRVRLAHAPTPLEPMARLRDALGGEAVCPRLWIKRDDCTGLATGGNKTRKLEYLLAEAEAEGASAVVTFGALQSNHARQTAAACAHRGLSCELILRDAVAWDEPAYRFSGNLILDDLLGARVHRVQDGEDPADVLRSVMQARADAGERCYVVPTGGSNAVGALGYARCALEIADACRQRGLLPTALVHATSTGGTQAGLVAGSLLAGLTTRVIGINTYTPDDETVARAVADLAQAVLDRVAPELSLPGDAVEVRGGQLGAGYGIPTEAMSRAVRLVARCEGVLLDPVYSGKAMAGLIALIEQGAFDPADDVVFVHTGGSVALGVYTGAFRT